jgi:flavin prenyltransferase
MQNNKIVVGVTGASGSIYAKALLDRLTAMPTAYTEVGLVFSDNAIDVWEHELNDATHQTYPFKVYQKQDFFAPFASGSAQYNIMFVVPCSMGTMARIAHGISNDLITRSADVILKERRQLILLVRDTPYSSIHIQNMKIITDAGGIICPCSPSFYSQPKTFEELAYTVVDRALDLAGLPVKSTYRWQD